MLRLSRFVSTMKSKITKYYSSLHTILLAPLSAGDQGPHGRGLIFSSSQGGQGFLLLHSTLVPTQHPACGRDEGDGRQILVLVLLVVRHRARAWGVVLH
jgi:hypothetical protein